MVVGGYNITEDKLDQVELISLDPENHPVPNCLRNLGPFPLPLSGASGAELRGT